MYYIDTKIKYLSKDCTFNLIITSISTLNDVGDQLKLRVCHKSKNFAIK